MRTRRLQNNSQEFFNPTWEEVWGWTIVFLFILLGIVSYAVSLGLMFGSSPEIVSPLPKYLMISVPVVEAAVLAPTPTPTEHEQIDAYIREVFGDDQDKAFKLLSCENSAHNPNAVNTAGNTPAGSRDIGVFQINEFWQKTQGKFLFNWHVNIDIAYQLYKENDNSFRMWSCGSRFSI